MPRSPRQRPVATLWRLAWSDDSELTCVVYRAPAGMELRLESAAGTVVSEPFELQPKALARTQSLRASLMRRGWRDITPARVGRTDRDPA